MRFEVFAVVFLFVFHTGHGVGFFSKFKNRGRNGNNQANNFDVCETVRIMPRIAMAVVGGAPLKNENSAPYIAAVGERTSNGSISWFCGGSLVASHHILTAAHCLVSRNVSTVRLGSFSTKTRTTQNDYEVSETIIHPAYKITESYNDIGILIIKDRISLDSNIKPVCLPQNNEKYEKEQAKVIGWGAEEFGGEGTQKLQQVEVEVYTNDNCEKAYRNSTIAPKTFPKGIKSEQLCAGSKKGGKDACQGDSGGPLVLTDEQGIVRQIGIVSTGAGCGFKMYPGVYTRVSSYTDWITQQIKKNNSVQSNQKNYLQKEDSKRKYNPTSKQNETSTQPQQNATLLSLHSYDDNFYNNKHEKGSRSTEKNHVPHSAQKIHSSKESCNGEYNSSKLHETSTKPQQDTHLGSRSDGLHTKLANSMPLNSEKSHSSKFQNQHYNENFPGSKSYSEVLGDQNNKISVQI